MRPQFALAALLLVGCAPKSLTAAPAKPAFLDSADQVRIWLDKPMTEAQLQGKFQFTLDGKPVAIKAVQTGGQPEWERVLPRSAGRIILAGTLQSALGGKEWDPDGEVTQMTEVKPGIHELIVRVPKGRFEYKITRNGSWNENYGAGFVAAGDNMAITIPADGTIVKFVVDFNLKTIRNSLEHPSEVLTPKADSGPSAPASAPTTYPVAVLTLDQPIRPDQVDDELIVSGLGNSYRVYARDFLNDKAFHYDRQLGAIYSKKQTTFKVWSPVSSEASLVLKSSKTVKMTKNSQGVWSATVPGDLHDLGYKFSFKSYGETRTATDINCFAANKDSTWSVVVDLDRTDPAGWPSQPKVRHKSQTDAILYELHVRDFTVHPDSGVKPEFRGKYAGMGQRGTRIPGTTIPTGLDYLVNLGVTDIHLLPVQNFLLSHEGDYTWGYATNLFNVPEESYSTVSTSPTGVIREFKGMVKSMHEAGLRVVMDVVYNHTWPPDGKDSAFWQTVPFYYLRTNDQGQLLNESGVGNALADERLMARKYVRDSLIYWMNEYKIDGFRFDLIGMHRPESVRDWAKAMRKVRPDVILYGEPWTGGGPTYFGKGAQRGSGVAVFNDRFRGTFRSDLDGSSLGFLTGGGADRFGLEMAIRGWIDTPGQSDGFTDSPQETVNYISAHDNLSLLDRIAKTSIPDEFKERAVRFGGAAVLLSQGVPFLEGGAQMGRTKGGNHNSYDAGDKVNGYDWTRGQKFQETNNYYKGLIALRKAHASFTLDTADQVRRALKFWPAASTPEKTIAFTLDGTIAGDPFKEYLVIFHGNKAESSLMLPKGEWQVLVSGKQASAKPIGKASGSIQMEPLTAYVFAR